MPDVEKVTNGLGEIQQRFAQSLELRHEYDPDDDAVVDIIYKADIDLLRDAITLIKEQNELVRCADCRHAEVSPSGLIKCRGIFRSREWYCADGERRND